MVAQSMWLLAVSIQTQNVALGSEWNAGPLLTKKTPSCGYRDPHGKPKTVWRPS